MPIGAHTETGRPVGFWIDREAALEYIYMMFLGENCKYCGRTYQTFEDLHDTVYAGDHPGGRLACRSCWEANNPKKRKP